MSITQISRKVFHKSHLLDHHQLSFNNSFSDCVSRFPLVLFIYLFRKKLFQISDTGFLRARRASCQPNINLKAMKKHCTLHITRDKTEALAQPKSWCHLTGGPSEAWFLHIGHCQRCSWCQRDWGQPVSAGRLTLDDCDAVPADLKHHQQVNNGIHNRQDFIFLPTCCYDSN